MTVRLVAIVSYSSSLYKVISRVIEEESREHSFIGIVVSDKASTKHISDIENADAVLMYIMSSRSIPYEVCEAIKRSRARVVISIYPEDHLEVLRCSQQLLSRVRQYFIVGGENNLRQVIHIILKELGVDVEVDEIEEIPWHGIYHPRYGVLTDIGGYLDRYKRVGDYTIGILFYRTYWLYERNLIDKLVEVLEENRLNVVPVFTYGSRDDGLGAPPAEESIRRFFFLGDKPVVDAVLNMLMFFLLDRGAWYKHSDRVCIARGIELLKKLNVPIITPSKSFYLSIDEWLRDPHGIDYMSMIYTVILPEVDGLIEPVFVSGARKDQGLGLDLATIELYDEHLHYIAKRIKKWVELSKKPPNKRRVAIVLISPPCKSLEANIGVGMGLDVPESIARLLQRLKDRGYDVGSNIPRDGGELIKIIVSKKAFYEFRWTSVKDVVSCGGALDFVDRDLYMSWFNELPEAAREKITKSWGHPDEVLKKSPSSGMVFNGRFVIPGVRFGNIVLVPQPKFGCSGARCDGKACKILHDPLILPPHEWLAVYRWITRVFRADVLIHFGTHGYLEFRPGKGVGLSPNCWPEISLDDIPHLYVYIVSNPMEGVIAKRRSYAVIVDHMYPPMALAEVLEDLDRLISEYWKAVHVGELHRARAVFNKIVEECKRNNIRVGDLSKPDEVVHEVYSYISTVRESQINMGLHVFGGTVEDPEKLASYAVSVLLHDTARVPSILRVLAELLDLDYDDMRKKPHEVNKFGITNSEILNILRKTSVETLKILINKGATPSTLDEKELVHVLANVLEKNLSMVFCNTSGNSLQV